MEKARLNLPTRVILTAALIVGQFGLAACEKPIDAAVSPATPSSLVTPSIATGIPGNGGYTGTDGQCHIGPPNVAQGQNGCQDGQPIVDVTNSNSTAVPTGIPGNGGYTGTDGQCHIGPPNVAQGQNGCQDGQPILGGN